MTKMAATHIYGKKPLKAFFWLNKLANESIMLLKVKVIFDRCSRALRPVAVLRS